MKIHYLLTLLSLTFIFSCNKDGGIDPPQEINDNDDFDERNRRRSHRKNSQNEDILPEVESTPFDELKPFEQIKSALRYSNMDLIQEILQKHELTQQEATQLWKTIFDDYHSNFNSANFFVFLDKLLSLGVDINKPFDKDGNTALHNVAFWYGNQSNIEKVATWLLDNGAKLDARSKCNWTPLDRAIESKSKVLTKLFLERGAPTSRSKATIPNSIDYLLKTSEFRDDSLPDKDWRPEVDYSHKSNNEFKSYAKGAIRKMRQQKKPISDPSTAVFLGERATAKKLIKEKNIQLKNDSKKALQLLKLAVKNGHYEILVDLIQQGASPLLKDEYGCTLLDWARNPQIKSFLQRKGVKYAFPLHAAILLKDTTYAREILSNQAMKEKYINLMNKIGGTPLSHAAYMHDLNMVQLLIDHGASLTTFINRQDTRYSDNGKCSLLKLIGELGDTKMIKLLLKNNIPINKNDKAELRRLREAAYSHPGSGLAAALIQKGVKFTIRDIPIYHYQLQDMKNPKKEDFVQYLKALQKAGIDLSSTDLRHRSDKSKGQSILHYAVHKAIMPYVKAIVEVAPSLVHLKDEQGRKPLALISKANPVYNYMTQVTEAS